MSNEQDTAQPMPDRTFKSAPQSVDAKIRLHEIDGYRVSTKREENGLVHVVMRHAPEVPAGSEVPPAGEEELQRLRSENLDLKSQLQDAQDALSQATSDLGKATNEVSQLKKALAAAKSSKAKG